MKPWLIAYLATGATYVALNAAWLRWAVPTVFRPALGDLLAARLRMGPTVVLALIYIAALVWFAVRAGVAVGVPLGVINGAALGLVAYGASNLGNRATLKDWPLPIALVDIAWGVAVSALASGVGSLAVRHFAVATGAA